MRVATNPPKNVTMKDWKAFQAATQTELFGTPEIVVVETSNDYQGFVRRLQSQIRPFAVALLAPKHQ